MANLIDEQRVRKEFQDYYQKSISEMKEGHPQFGDIGEIVIVRMQFDVLWGRIPKTREVYDFEKLSEFRKSVFYKALIQQIYYVLKEGDFTDISGYDVSTNTFLSQESIEKIAVSKMAVKTLKEGGLFYRGIDGTYSGSNRFPGGWL